MSLRYYQHAVARMTGMKLAEDQAGHIEANDAGTVSGVNEVNLPASEVTGIDTSPDTYRWSQDLPQDHPATTGRKPGLETLTSGSEAISADQNLTMLHRTFENMQEAQRVDRELIAQNFDAAAVKGGYVTRSKTLLEMVRGTAGRH